MKKLKMDNVNESQLQKYQELKYEQTKIQQEIDYMLEEQIELQDLKTTKEVENEHLKTE